MTFDFSVAVSWILFLALFPLSFFWLRRAWRIFYRRDHSEVALKRGEAPPDAAKWAPFELAINAAAGAVLVYVIGAVLIVGLDYGTWTAIAGSTIWCKFFASFALGRTAHANFARKRD
jgi:hypothetical protein